MRALKDLISKRDLSLTEAGRQIGAHTHSGRPLDSETVRRYTLPGNAEAARTPEPDKVRAIRLWSQGRIRAEHWQDRYERAHPLKRAA